MNLTDQVALGRAVLSAAEMSNDTVGDPLQPLLVRASSSAASCPLLLALRDLLVEASSSPSHSHTASAGVGGLLDAQLQRYEREVEESRKRREPLRIAQDKLRAELHRVEAQLTQMEEAAKKAQDGALVCRALIQALGPVQAQMAEEHHEMQMQAQPQQHHAHTHHEHARHGGVPSPQHLQHASVHGGVQHPSSLQQPLQDVVPARGPTPSQPTKSGQQMDPRLNAAPSPYQAGGLPTLHHPTSPTAAASTAPPELAATTMPAQGSTYASAQNMPSSAPSAASVSANLAGRAAVAAGLVATTTPASNEDVIATAAAALTAVSAAIMNHLDPNSVAREAARAADALIRAEGVLRATPYRSGSIGSGGGSSSGYKVDDEDAVPHLCATIVECLGAVDAGTQLHSLRALITILRRYQQPDASGASATDLLRQRVKVHRIDAALGATSVLFDTLVALVDPELQPHDDDMRAEALECLSVITVDDAARDRLGQLRLIPALSAVVAASTSEPVLERALLLMWALASGPRSEAIRVDILESGGLRAVVDLLYTDSLPILDNAMIALGYLTRDPTVKKQLPDIGALEKIVSCLWHPDPGVIVKTAGVVWNAAVDERSREVMRNLGAVPILLQLLDRPNLEAARENITGALWNFTVSPDVRKLVGDLECLGTIVTSLQAALNAPTGVAENIIDNTTGILCNCSQSLDNRGSLCTLGVFQPLLRVISRPTNERAHMNAAIALRFLPMNDHGKAALREVGGIAVISQRLQLALDNLESFHATSQQGHASSDSRIVVPKTTTQTTETNIADKLATALWLLSVVPEHRVLLREFGAFPVLLRMLQSPPQSGNGTGGGAASILPLFAKEKAIGAIRNCCSVSENRRPLIDLGAARAVAQCATDMGLVPDADAAAIASIQRPVKENLAFIIWALAREARGAALNDGALPVAATLVRDPAEQVVEQAAGAIAALINGASAAVRDAFVASGGLDGLLAQLRGAATAAGATGLPGASNAVQGGPNNTLVGEIGPSSASAGLRNNYGPFIVHNVLLALRYATTGAHEPTLRRFLERGGVEAVTELLRRRCGEFLSAAALGTGASATSVPAAGGHQSEPDMTREALLLLRNVISLPGAAGSSLGSGHSAAVVSAITCTHPSLFASPSIAQIAATVRQLAAEVNVEGAVTSVQQGLARAVAASSAASAGGSGAMPPQQQQHNDALASALKVAHHVAQLFRA